MQDPHLMVLPSLRATYTHVLHRSHQKHGVEIHHHRSEENTSGVFELCVRFETVELLEGIDHMHVRTYTYVYTQTHTHVSKLVTSVTELPKSGGPHTWSIEDIVQ